MKKLLLAAGTLALGVTAWTKTIGTGHKRAKSTQALNSSTPTNSVLLTVSGTISADIKKQIEQKKRPLADYIAMVDTFGADLLDYSEARRRSGWVGQSLEKIGGPNLLLAWTCFTLRHQYDVIFTDGEQIGIPLAILTKVLGLFGQRARHLMIVHILSVGKKMLFFDKLAIQSDIDTFFVYSTWQKQFIEQRWNVPSERVVFTPFMVDSHFFSPEQVQAGASELSRELEVQKRQMICSVGLEFRDYPTLIEAVRGLDLHVVVAAGSPWSKREDSTKKAEVPENVTVRRFTQYDLRQVYADSNFMVMPLYNVNFQAGVTAILEAMAMGKAVICSQTPGQTDVIIEGKTGLYVPPEQPQALRDAIQYLLNNPEEAKRMGEAGRKRIEEEMSLDCYVERLNEHVQK